MLKNKIRVVTYLRVGGKDQETIFRRNEELRKLLEKHKDDWEVVDNAFDYGISGRKENRPGLNHVLEMCNENQVDMVVTINPAMIAKDVLVYKDIYQKIESKKCALYIRDVHRDNIPKKAFNLNLFPKLNIAII